MAAPTRCSGSATTEILDLALVRLILPAIAGMRQSCPGMERHLPCHDQHASAPARKGVIGGSPYQTHQGVGGGPPRRRCDEARPDKDSWANKDARLKRPLRIKPRQAGVPSYRNERAAGRPSPDAQTTHLPSRRSSIAAASFRAPVRSFSGGTRSSTTEERSFARTVSDVYGASRAPITTSRPTGEARPRTPKSTDAGGEAADRFLRCNPGRPCCRRRSFPPAGGRGCRLPASSR